MFHEDSLMSLMTVMNLMSSHLHKYNGSLAQGEITPEVFKVNKMNIKVVLHNRCQLSSSTTTYHKIFSYSSSLPPPPRPT